MNGGKFDWSDYMPKGKKKGKWTPGVKNLNICDEGYHLTEHWCFWFDSEDNRIFEAEGKQPGDTDYDKTVFESVRLIRELHFTFDDITNSGDSNSGYMNSGNWNSGDRNSGDRNSGDRNSGNSNSGNWNSGNWNSGYRNSGNRNSGDRNSGDSNSGDSNSGNWNSGNYNSGFLNTDEPTVRMFNKDTGLKRDDIDSPDYFYFDIDDKIGYKKSFIKSFEKAERKDIDKTMKLPNFDYDLFEEISGITKMMLERD